MCSKRGELYKKLCDACKEAYKESFASLQQQKANELWGNLKQECGKDDSMLSEKVSEKIKDLLQKASKGKFSFTDYFKKSESGIHSSNHNNNLTEVRNTSSSQQGTPQIDLVEDEINDNELEITEKKYPTYSQDLTKKKVQILEKKLNAHLLVRNKMGSDLDFEKSIVELRKELSNNELCEFNPELKEKLKLRHSVGHPQIDEDQPLLLEVISDLAIFGSAADDRRRTETIRSIKTLDQLHAELLNHGFSLSRSATYLRLLPKNSKTIEGKRHVKTVPVRLIRAQADFHRDHIDGPFATATIRYLESLASFLGPEQVLFISQDDKARVPLGITAANKQAPLIMHAEYRIALPDHDWVVAERHKLIPSVYAGIVIEPAGQGNPSAVSYSGPTFISIRSGKHSSSTANSHAQDLETLLNLKSFQLMEVQMKILNIRK